MSRNPMLSKIHIAKKELSLEDDDYRAILMRVTGKASSGACCDGELEALISEFKRLGWAPKTSTFKPSAKPHVRKVFAMWGELGRAGALRDPSRAALQSFVLRQTGVNSPEWLSSSQANEVTEAFKAMLKRHKVKS